MNTEEAKLILGSIHRDADHERDQDIEQALALLDGDQDLHLWYEQERAFDDAVTSKLAQVEPPADLKASLVSLLNETQSDTGGGRKVTWLRPQFLAAAAAVVLVSFFAIQLFTPSVGAREFEAFRTDMVNVASSGIQKLDHEGATLADLCDWLKQHGATFPGELPPCIACAEGIGCKVFDWNGEKVSLICMRNGSGEVVHCFIVPLSHFDAPLPEKRIRKNLTRAALETCGWSDTQNVYLLVGSEPGVEVMAVE